MELQIEEECQVLVHAQATDWTRFVGHILWVAIRQSHPADICWLSHHVSPNVHSGIYYAILAVLRPTHPIWPTGTLVHTAQNAAEKMASKSPQVTHGVGTGT